MCSIVKTRTTAASEAKSSQLHQQTVIIIMWKLLNFPVFGKVATRRMRTAARQNGMV